jgi:heterotetrameric sarcosine oxidase delta subunit
MLLLPCPTCGPRNEQEFVCLGEASDRPAQPQALDDAAWGQHLYARDNPDAPVREHWWHVHGCRCWLEVRRDPHTQAILACQALGDRP